MSDTAKTNTKVNAKSHGSTNQLAYALAIGFASFSAVLLGAVGAYVLF